MSKEKGLPEGWCWAKLSDLGRWSGGGTPSKARDEFWASGNIPWVSPKDMKTLRITDSEDHLSTAALEETNLKLCPAGTVLVVVRSGILQRTLPVAVSQMPVTMNQDMKGISPEDGIVPMYVAYYLILSEHDILSRCSKDGTTVASIESESLKTYSIPLPPTTEQYRIVAAIEQQFTRLDAGVAALRRAQAKLKRYRAAVLKAAVEGKLTEAWRAEHPATETASLLLERILKERRAKWEADLRVKGKDPAKVRYVESAKPDVEGLPGLPEGWCWATVEQVGDIGTGATPLRSRKEYYEGGMIPWITSGALNADMVTYAEEFITKKALAETNTKIFPSGTLLLAMYGEGQTRGKVSELKIDAATNQACAAIVFRPSSGTCQPYVKYFLFSNYFEIRRLSSGGVQPNLNLSIVKRTAIPLPPLAEQEQIVEELERRLSVVSELEATVEANLRRAERLRQSILNEAFAGRLVPQDPNDEPASVLLGRIHSERKKGTTGNGRCVSVSEPVKIDLAGTQQAELW